MQRTELHTAGHHYAAPLRITSGFIMIRLMLPGEGNILEKMLLDLLFIYAPTDGNADCLQGTGNRCRGLVYYSVASWLLRNVCSLDCLCVCVCVCFITVWWNSYWRSISRRFIRKHKYHRYNEAMVLRVQDACSNTHTSNRSSSVNSCCFILQCVRKMPGWHESNFLLLMAVLMYYRKYYGNRYMLYDSVS